MPEPELPANTIPAWAATIIANVAEICGYFADTRASSATDCPQYCAFSYISQPGVALYLWRSG